MATSQGELPGGDPGTRRSLVAPGWGRGHPVRAWPHPVCGARQRRRTALAAAYGRLTCPGRPARLNRGHERLCRTRAHSAGDVPRLGALLVRCWCPGQIYSQSRDACRCGLAPGETSPLLQQPRPIWYDSVTQSQRTTHTMTSSAFREHQVCACEVGGASIGGQ